MPFLHIPEDFSSNKFIIVFNVVCKIIQVMYDKVMFLFWNSMKFCACKMQAKCEIIQSSAGSFLF